MERFTVVNYCFGFLGLLLLQGVLNVEGRSIFNPGKSESIEVMYFIQCQHPFIFFYPFQFFCLCYAKQVVLFFLCSPAGDNVFNPKEDTYRQSKILTLLLSKSLAPIEKDDPLGERSLRRFISKAQSSTFFCSDCNVFLSAGLELANKLAELEEVRTWGQCGILLRLPCWIKDALKSKLSDSSIFLVCLTSGLCPQLRSLRENLELEKEITANLEEGKSINRKRGERKCT